MIIPGIHSSKFCGCILIFIIINLFSILSKGFVYARSIKQNESFKSIKLENGDVIDCVHIYEQPAFSHHLLKNHTIQIKPSSDPTSQLRENFEIKPLEDVFEACHCLEGTIPIIRNNKMNFSISTFQSVHLNYSNVTFKNPPGREYAQASILNGRYYGAQAALNVWHPVVLENEVSLAQFWVVGEQGNLRETVEAGWEVNPVHNDTKFFIYWTADNYVHTGCVNLLCPGFVQTNRKYPIGATIKPVSTFGGKQYDIFIKIYKDKKTGNWWLQLQDQVLGYWPKHLFKILSENANRVTWGGEILNHRRVGRQTGTHMGSGRFPSEGYGKAAYFSTLGYVDDLNVMRTPGNFLIPYASRPQCYDVHVVNKISPQFGKYFYYGGPGYSDRCTG
ncbi:hypothetical protein ACFE04_031440 [Oxalis oulophora]